MGTSFMGPVGSKGWLDSAGEEKCLIEPGKVKVTPVNICSNPIWRVVHLIMNVNPPTWEKERQIK